MLVDQAHVDQVFRSPHGYLWRIIAVNRKPVESAHVIAMSTDPDTFDEATNVTAVFHERALVMCSEGGWCRREGA